RAVSQRCYGRCWPCWSSRRAKHSPLDEDLPGSRPVDLRKGFDSLAALVETVLAKDPLSGQLFVLPTSERTASSSCTGTATAMPSGITRSSHTTPISSSLQELAETPIISLAALLRLVEWIQSRQAPVQGGAAELSA